MNVMLEHTAITVPGLMQSLQILLHLPLPVFFSLPQVFRLYFLCVKLHPAWTHGEQHI